MPGTETVGKLLKNHGGVLTIDQIQTAEAAARKMCDHNVGSLVVVDADGRVAGILTERDVLRLVASAAAPSQVVVAEIMTSQVVRCSPGTAVQEARRLMAKNEIRHLPVVTNGLPVGMISSRDLLANELDAAKAVVCHQSMLLAELEKVYPGITRVQTSCGRIVI